MVSHMLSTSDNPWNPFTDYDEWEAWDVRAGYYTSGLVDRVVVFPYEASDRDQNLALERGLQDIMAELSDLTTEDGTKLYVLIQDPNDPNPVT